VSYFDHPPEFLGEMPIPEPIGDSDPGISALKANADHTHAFLLGGISTTWSTLLLSVGCAPYGGGFRTPEFTNVGNLVFVRGLVSCGGLTGFGQTIANMPADLAPKATELAMGMGFNMVYRFDVQTSGAISLNPGVGTGSYNPAWVSLGAPYLIYCVD
jgi:hypothetical protein